MFSTYDFWVNDCKLLLEIMKPVLCEIDENTWIWNYNENIVTYSAQEKTTGIHPSFVSTFVGHCYLDPYC